MNTLDLVIIALLIGSLLRGISVGLVRQLASTTGLILGLALGIFLEGRLIHLAATPIDKLIFAFIIVLFCVIIATTIFEGYGIMLKRRLERFKLTIINTFDKLFGAVVATITTLFMVWLAAALFGSLPGSGLERQLKNSWLISQLNSRLPSAPALIADLGHFISPNVFPDVFNGPEPKVDLDKPLPSLGELDPAVQKVRPSLVKIDGEGCGGISLGSGFVADTGLVITNAHVVAGVNQPYITDSNGRRKAQLIWFDPNLDMAVLRTTNLAGKPLPLVPEKVTGGTQGAILGFPGGGDLKIGPAVVLETFRAVGRDIYNQNASVRQVYSLRGIVDPGNSGGPLINKDGAVIGLIFAESTTSDEVGYALVMDQVIDGLEQAKQRTSALSTSCAQ